MRRQSVDSHGRPVYLQSVCCQTEAVSQTCDTTDLWTILAGAVVDLSVSHREEQSCNIQ